MVMPLALLNTGEQAEVIDIFSGQTFNRKLEHSGLRIGKKVEVLQHAQRGPLLVKIDETRLAIERGIAMKILVRGHCNRAT
jgi:ferrous iron transport protein A